MDNKTVSTIAINESIDYMSTQLMAKLDDRTEQILGHFDELKSKGILTSANIDGLVAEVKNRMLTLQNDFDLLADNIKKNMATSGETIAANRDAIQL